MQRPIRFWNKTLRQLGLGAGGRSLKRRAPRRVHFEELETRSLMATVDVGLVQSSMNEGETFTFQVSVPSASGQDVVVAYTTQNGTATAGSDYNASSGTVTIASGLSTATISVSTINDSLDEGNETFSLTLSGGDSSVSIGTATATATIIDNDSAPTLTVGDVSVTEGTASPTTATFAVTLSTASGQDIVVGYNTANGTATSGSDYTSTSGQLTITAGNTTGSISVPISNDSTYEANETFTLQLTSVTNASITDGTATGTIGNDDSQPTVSASDLSITEGTGGSSSAVFTVTLSALSGQDVVIGYNTTDATATAGSDYTSVSGQLTITASNSTGQIVVPISTDASDESNETFSLLLTSATNASISDATAVGTILDDDGGSPSSPTVSINDVSVTEGTGGETSAVFAVILSSTTMDDVVVGYASGNGNATAGIDYTAVSGELTITAGNTIGYIVVPVATDSRFELNESFSVRLTAVTNADLSSASVGFGTIGNDDEQITAVINDASALENAGSATFSISLSRPSDLNVLVGYYTSNGSATSSSDYTSKSGTVTITAGNTVGTISVPIADDSTVESNETFSVYLTSATGNVSITDSTGLGTILNDDLPPYSPPSVSINSVSVAESAASAIFTVTLSHAATDDVVLGFTTTNGSAVAGSDYTSTSGYLTITTGNTVGEIVIPIVNDSVYESNESFSINFTSAVNAASVAYYVAGHATIGDDDVLPTVTVSDVSLAEGTATPNSAVFTVSLSASTTENVVIGYYTSNGTATASSDYTSTSGSLTITAGNSTGTIAVPLNNDPDYESDETFSLHIYGATSNASVTDATAIGTIGNDDEGGPFPPTVSINDVSVTEGTSVGTTAVFTVTLSASSTEDVVVGYYTSNGTATASSDYTSTSGSLTITAGNTTGTIAVPIVNDSADESNETFSVSLTSVTDNSISDGIGIGTIGNDDAAPTLSINDVSVTEGTSEGTTAVFTVTLSASSTEDVVVGYYTNNGTATASSDYTSTSGSLTITAGNTTGTIAVPIINDSMDESNETFSVSLTSGSGNSITDATGIGTIGNDDVSPALSIGDVTVTEGTSFTTSANFTLSLSAPSGKPVVVGYNVSDGTASASSDYYGSTGVVTIAPGNTVATIAIPVVGDASDEMDETFNVNLTSASNASITDSTGLGKIIDDDNAPTISISSPPSAVLEGQKATFTISLSAPSGKTITVDYETGDGTATTGDYHSNSGTVIFEAGETSHTIQVATKPDNVDDEETENFSVTLSNATNSTIAAGSAQGEIKNDAPIELFFTCTCSCSCSTLSSFTSPALGTSVAKVGDLVSNSNDSNTAILTGVVAFDSGTASADSIVVSASMGGLTTSSVFYDPSTAVSTKDYKFSLPLDVSGLSEGKYVYTITVLEQHGGSTISKTVNGTYFVEKPVIGPFGDSWQHKDLDRLKVTGEGAYLLAGDGQRQWFKRDDSDGSFLTDRGDKSGLSLEVLSGGGFKIADGGGSSRTFNSLGLLISEQDANSRTKTYAYADADSDGQEDDITAITDPVGRVSTFAYTGSRVTSITDFGSRVTTLGYSDGRLTSYTEPDPDGGGTLPAPETSFSYDEDGLLTTLTSSVSGTTSYTYGLAGTVTSMTDPTSVTMDYVAARIAAVVDTSGGNGTALTPAALIAAEDAVGSFDHPDFGESIVQNDRFGNPVRSVDTDGNVTTFLRDANGRVLVRTGPDPDGAGPLTAPVTSYAYDSRGNVTEVEYPDGSLESWTYHWSLDTPLAHINRNGFETHYVYSSSGNVLFEVNIVGELDDEINEETDDIVTGYTYTDAPVLSTNPPAGLLASMTDALGNLTEYEYNALGLPTKITYAVGTADEAFVEYTYDAFDRMATSIDELGRTTTYAYDALDRVTSVTAPDPDGVGPLTSPVTSYEYDAAGRLVKEIDPLGRETVYTYNARGEQIKVERPDHDSDSELTTTEFTYDAAGQQTSITDPLGRVTTNSYNTLGQLIEQELADPDGAGPLVAPITTYTYDHLGRPLTVTDPLGNVTSYAYGNFGRVVTITQPDPDGVGPLAAPTTEMTYDALGQLVSSEDALGRITTYEYDALGRRIQVTQPDPDGVGPLAAPITQFAYDKAGNLRFVTDLLGSVTEYQYDARNRQVLTILPDPDGVGTQTSPESSTTYDAASQVVASTDALGRVTASEFDALGRLIKLTQADPDGVGGASSPEILYAYDAAGRMTSMTDALGNITSYEYDLLDNCVEVTQADPDGAGSLTAPVSNWEYDAAGQLLSGTDPLGRVTSYEYDDLGRQISVTQPDPDGVGPLASPVTNYSYDDVGNLLTTTDPLGNVTTYEYDHLHRQVSVTQADPDGAGPLTAPVSSWDFDAAGQLLSSTDPLGRVTSYAYDDLGRQLSVTQPDPDGIGLLASPVTSYSYDAVSNLLETTDPLGNVTTYTYDNLYRRVQEEQPDPDGIGALTRPTTVYAYDAVGNRLTLTDPVGNTTTWTYDALNRLITDTNELGKTRSFVYDAANNLVERTDRNGRVIEYVYDNLHRNIEENWLDSMSAVIRTLSFEYDAAGYLTTASDPTATYTYDYDGLGRTLSETQAITGLTPTVTLTRAYDANGNRTELAATVGSAADYLNTYAFDALNRLTSLTQAGQLGGNTVAEKRFDFAHNSAGQFTALDRYADLAGSEFVANTTYSYDGLGRLTSLQHSQGVTSLAGYDYTYDAASRITAINSVLDGLTDYTNDATGQLTDADHNGQPDEAYSYDENGNRVTSTVGTNNQILSDGTFDYEYDDEGNMVAKETIATGERVEYVWDHRNRLIAIVSKDALGAVTQKVDQAYDVFQRWVHRSVDSDGAGPASATDTFFTYEGNQIALEFDGTTASDLAHRYLWGDLVDQILADEQVSSLASAGDVIYPLTDHLNTTRDLATYDAGTDITTNANHRRFDSFGNLISQTNGSITILVGFTARPFDVATGLQWNLNRWYVSTLGTWMSEDPIGLGPDSNPRRYVLNQPTMLTDPNGLDPFTEGFRESNRQNAGNGGARPTIPGLPNVTADELKAIDLAGNNAALRDKVIELIKVLRNRPAPSWFNYETVVFGGRCVWWSTHANSDIIDAKSKVDLSGISVVESWKMYLGVHPLFTEHHFLTITLPNGKVFYADSYLYGGNDHIFFELDGTLVDKDSQEYADFQRRKCDAMDATFN